MNIFLIGMPGCGKSRTAKFLQEAYGYTIVDLDAYIVKMANAKIDKIMTRGLAYFRQLEHQALKRINDQHDRVVVACGGGIVTNSINKEVMKKGLTIYLNADVELIKQHLKHSNTVRPLLKTKTVEELYDERKDLYLDFADQVIDYKDYQSAASTIDKIVKNIKRILVINGPNLNMLGLRDPKHYGSLTLDKINYIMAEEKMFEFEFFQSNWEGAIIDKIQTYKNYDGIIINPAAYTHTSVAIHDALEIVDIPKVEVHLSMVDERETFRKINFIHDVVDVCFQGEKEQSYLKAVEYLKNKLIML